jgi:hypothetical protein
MSAPVSTEVSQEPLTVLPPELIPSVEDLVTEDDKPVDNIYAEKQHRLLTATLYSSWSGPGAGRPFVAMTNVGMFYAINQPPLVPDCLLSLDVRLGDLRLKENRSYFFWVFGKAPDAILEVVSNKEEEELGQKLRQYAQIGIPYYGVWDPDLLISKTRLQVFGLRIKSYQRMAKPWLPEIGLGLTVWPGVYETMDEDWLRWCDREGRVLPTGEELAEREHLRADQAEKQATQAEKRAEKAEKRAKRLAEQLRKLGIDPKNGNG